MRTAAATLAQSRANRLTAVLNLFSSTSDHAPSPPVALAFLVAAFFSLEAACDAKTKASRRGAGGRLWTRARRRFQKRASRAAPPSALPTPRPATRRARDARRRRAHVDTRRRRADGFDAGRRACRAGVHLAMVSARARSAANVWPGCFILPPSSQSGTLWMKGHVAEGAELKHRWSGSPARAWRATTTPSDGPDTAAHSPPMQSSA